MGGISRWQFSAMANSRPMAASAQSDDAERRSGVAKLLSVRRHSSSKPTAAAPLGSLSPPARAGIALCYFRDRPLID